jgi:Asp-tRNA(Asn)/Glu-tRNA(Gln) amidotransferase A subunit family amidase
MASVGVDPGDNATASIPAGELDTNYAASLDALALMGMRFGLLESFMNRTASAETDPVNEAMANTTAMLEQVGATVIPIQDMYDAVSIQVALDTQRFEFREVMDEYLSRHSLAGDHPQSLSELYSGEDFFVLPNQREYVRTALISSTSNQTSDGQPGYDAVQEGIHKLTRDLHETFKMHRLDALIYPEQKNLVVKLGAPSQSGRNGILAALTGFPVVTVPIGFSRVTNTAPKGVPIGMEVMGLPWTEEKLLQIAFQMQELKTVRRTPEWANESDEVKHYEDVPVIMPDRGNLPAEYSVGRL